MQVLRPAGSAAQTPQSGRRQLRRLQARRASDACPGSILNQVCPVLRRVQATGKTNLHVPSASRHHRQLCELQGLSLITCRGFLTSPAGTSLYDSPPPFWGVKTPEFMARTVADDASDAAVQLPTSAALHAHVGDRTAGFGEWMLLLMRSPQWSFENRCRRHIHRRRVIRTIRLPSHTPM